MPPRHPTDFVCLTFQISRQVPGYEAAAPPLGLAALDGGAALATVFSAGALFSAVAGAASALSVLAASAGLASPADASEAEPAGAPPSSEMPLR